MLHSGILPHHTKWVKLFENLQYVVIDEIHAYRGVFGSNLANVIRRLTRLCKFYGSNPQFICCSATIANPGELASTLIGRPVDVIDQSGQRRAEKSTSSSITRRWSTNSSASAKAVLTETPGTWRRPCWRTTAFPPSCFAKSRGCTVEVLTRHLKESVRDPYGNAGRVRGYRGGYLPGRCAGRSSEGLAQRRGSTPSSPPTRLELGVDIGSTGAPVCCAAIPGPLPAHGRRRGARVGAKIRR